MWELTRDRELLLYALWVKQKDAQEGNVCKEFNITECSPLGNLASYMLFVIHAVPIWAAFGRYLSNYCSGATGWSTIELPGLPPTWLEGGGRPSI